MLKRIAYAAAWFALLAGAAFAAPIGQPQAGYVGPLTANHCAKWNDTVGTLADAGSNCGTGAGSVTTTGSPASGNLTKFSGATSITNGDLAGDVSTSGTLTTTLNVAVNHTWTKSQRAAVETITISTATFTPDFDAGQNYTMTLVHASCPCTLANPSTTPVAGQSGVFEVIQSATGSDTITTWGSDYTFAGGTSTITLSTGASARDYISYYVADSTHIVLSTGALNATH